MGAGWGEGNGSLTLFLAAAKQVMGLAVVLASTVTVHANTYSVIWPELSALPPECWQDTEKKQNTSMGSFSSLKILCIQQRL